MAVFTASVPAADAPVGSDLFANEPQVRQSGALRTVDFVSLTGSAAAGDTTVDLRIGSMVVATLPNSATGFPNQDSSKVNLDALIIPPGEPLSAIVRDAPATNPINIQVGLTER